MWTDYSEHNVFFHAFIRTASSSHCSRLFRVIVKCSTCIINGIIGHPQPHTFHCFHSICLPACCLRFTLRPWARRGEKQGAIGSETSKERVPNIWKEQRERDRMSAKSLRVVLYLYLCKCVHTTHRSPYMTSSQSLYKSILIKHLYMRNKIHAVLIIV